MKKLMIATGAVIAFAAPALAKKDKVVFVETSAVKDKPVVTLDPTKAYVLVRSDGAIPLHLMRVPSNEDQARYDQLKAESFAEAREKYVKSKASYDKTKAANDKMSKSAQKLPLPPMPIEPTAENFEFTPFGLLTGVSIGPFNRFAKGKDGDKTSIYLQSVTPGFYRIYGMMSVVPGSGAYGSCFCMGSVKFETKPGEITDLGRFASREVAKREGGDNAKPVELAFEFKPSTTEGTVDPRLAGTAIRPALLKPVGKMPNYFGVTIDRFPATAGVIRYERDRIVDLTAGN